MKSTNKDADTVQYSVGRTCSQSQSSRKVLASSRCQQFVLSMTSTWPVNHLHEARVLLSAIPDRRGGWTAQQRVELLRQRWLADARCEPLTAKIPGRSEASAWPQLVRVRKVIGESLFTLGQREMHDSLRSQFIAGLVNACMHAQLDDTATPIPCIFATCAAVAVVGAKLGT